MNVEMLRGERAFAFSVEVVDVSYCYSVHFWEIRCRFLASGAS
jgi:hypothetical protein